MAAPLCLTPAAAQTAGTYTGTSADGNSISLLVQADTATGKLAITSATIFFKAPCAGSTLVLNEGEGFGLLADITAGKAQYVASYPGFWTSFNVAFSANGKAAAGLVTTVAPQLAPGTRQPRKVYLCTSPRQKMSLRLASTAVSAPLASQTYTYDRLGRIIGTVSH